MSTPQPLSCDRGDDRVTDRTQYRHQREGSLDVSDTETADVSTPQPLSGDKGDDRETDRTQDRHRREGRLDVSDTETADVSAPQPRSGDRGGERVTDRTDRTDRTDTDVKAFRSRMTGGQADDGHNIFNHVIKTIKILQKYSLLIRHFPTMFSRLRCSWIFILNTKHVFQLYNYI